MINIVAFPFHDWVKYESERWVGRDIHILRELARHPDVGQILIVNRPTSYPLIARAIARRRAWRVRGGQLLAQGPGWRLRRHDPKLFTLDIHIPDIVWTALLRRKWMPRSLVDSRTRAAVVSAQAAMGIGRPVVWCLNAPAMRLAASLPRRALVFDVIDDWLLHPGMEAYRQAAAEGYEIARREADAIFTVSSGVENSFVGAAGIVLTVPNAVDVDYFRVVAEAPDLKHIPRPRAGYIGMIESRFDVDLLNRVALDLPDVNFCLVGPFDRRRVRPLHRLSNIYFFGQRRFDEVPSYLAGFDVCMIPHVRNAFTDRMDPLKLYEYLAAGRPVVSTAIAGVDPFNHVIRVAETAEDFSAAIRELLLQKGGAEDRIQAARLHSWQSRVDLMLSTLSNQTANA